METVPWIPFLLLLGLVPLAGLAVAGAEERVGRGAFGLWLVWAGLIYPSGFVLLLAGASHHGPVLWWSYLALYLAQTFILGLQTARRLQDAGRSRWLGVPVLVPLLGLLPGLGLAFLAPAAVRPRVGRGSGWQPVPAV